MRAQCAIVDALRQSWPDLTIVGEEDGDAAAAAASAAASCNALGPLRHDLCFGGQEGPSETLADVCVFVDPLDGTREFVEGRLVNVQSLVGVSVRGRAVGGAVGLPFPTGTGAATEASAVVYGLVGVGTGEYGARGLPPSGSFGDGALPIVETGDSSNAVLAAARDAALAEGGSAHIVGGAGRKILAAAEDRATLSIQHMGTSLWDTCAPGAIAAALGGKVTDLFGAPLVHLPTLPSYKNSLGVVASAPGAGALHDQLCARMRQTPAALQLLDTYGYGSSASDGHAADIARSLDGAPLQLSALAAQLDVADGALRGYAAPEGSAFRGMMSDGVRLELDWDDVAGRVCTAAAGGTSCRPRSVFYKRVVMGDLASARDKALAAPFKLQRDVRSYAVEAAFLKSAACAQLASAGVRVPLAYHADLRPDDTAPIESKFALLLTDYSPADGWSQCGMLGGTEVRSALAVLARMHAHFWPTAPFWKDARAASELEAAVWPAGAYWQPSMQPAEQWSQLAEKMAGHVAKLGAPFADAAASAGVRSVSELGPRLQTVARDATAAAHPFDPAAGGDAQAFAPFRTLIHGDPKAANLFVRNDDGGACEVGMIDFQWCGFGLGATDVAHHLCAAVDPEVLLTDGAEAALLDHYHTELCAALGRNGAAPSAEEAASSLLPRAVLQGQYEAAVLDMGRLVFSYQWSRADFSKESLNRNSYNKNARSAAWLTRRVEELLAARG